MKIKIIGSGSAGNHISYAFRNFSKSITMTDKDLKSLRNSKKEIYLKRYKVWNKNIIQKIEDNDNDNYDLIIVSSPPKTHLKLINKNIKNSNLFLIEKPICEPDIKTIKKFEKIINTHKSKVFLCGYNHRLFPSTQKVLKILKKNKLQQNIKKIEVNFKENTSGFLKAHKWFKSLADSYLSKTKVGGGSLCEHSHAINLGQLFLNDKIDQLKLIKSKVKYIKNAEENYDYDSKIELENKGKFIQINQNFTTLPVEKNVKIFGDSFFIELIYNYEKSNDQIKFFSKKFNKIKTFNFKKKRSDDFFYEAEFLFKLYNGKINNEILCAKSGIKTMKIVVKALKKSN
ncbi:Gfo/Idh/MocA family oxidoreductase [Pelagibacterales bacterium SAG-MED50]|nr:Gfo/Idh/MocA family oxidoreductase [Pelagibacterales bacterium SAG-MED50]